MATNFGFKLAQRPVPASPNEDRREQRDNASERKEKKEKKHKKEPKAADAEVMASPEREKKEKKHKKDHSMSSPSLERSRSSTSRSHRKLRGESAPLSLDEQEKLVADLLAAEQQRRQCGDETREAERQRRDAALMAALAAEEERMERVAKNAERMRELSSKLKELATSYETHRVTIASALAPVKEKTEKLQLVQRNAEATRVTLEGMLSLTSLPEKLEPIAKAGPAGELSAFLAKLEEAKSAASLFESARHWKAGDTALLRLKPLITQMTTALDVPYARLLAKCGSAAESRKFGADATERPQLISSKRVEQLRRLISHLSAPYSTVNYLQEYTDSRCKFIRTTLKKLSSDVPPMLADGLGYPRGSHRVIMVTRAVLQLLLHEQWLSGSVLPHTAYDTAQTPITEAAVDALCGEGEMLTKDRGTETILPAMDACQTLSGLLPKFREILDGAETSKALRDVTDLHGRLSATCKRVLVDCEPMIKRGFRTTEIPVDGTVHEQTVNTLSLLRRLVDYQPLLASLLKDEYQTQRGPVKEFYSTLLAELRTQLQERAKKVKPVLAAIFLLNNFHFIAQAARTDLRPLLGDADLTDLESLQASARSSYRHSWNETLEFLWEPKNWQNNTSGKSVVKKKLKGFNSSLESLFAAQRHYAVPDAALRAQIRADIKSVLMPLYENFVQKYGAIDFSKNKGKYVKFSAQTLVAVIDRFFEDQPVAARKTTIASRLSSVAIVGKFT